MTHSVLVTDGEERSALAVVRSLGQVGYRVGVTSVEEASLAGSSRHATWSCRVPDPVQEPGDYVARLRKIAGAEAVDVLLPITEASLLAVLPERETLPDAAIPFPSFEKFRAITDKARVIEEARKAGVSAPDQIVLPGPDGPIREVTRALEFPVVLKPARSVGEAGSGRREVGVVHVSVREQLEPRVASLPLHAFPLLVQERIEGPGAGVFLLTWRGRVMAHFAHRRIREKPPSGGVSVYRESVRADETLLGRSVALLERFGWDGVAMVEYKIEEKSGDPYIMEINPRFWGSLQLAIDAGVDFPRLLVDLTLDKEVEPVSSYEIGVRTRWWWGEVDHVIGRVGEVNAAEGLGCALRTLYSCGRDLISDRGGRSESEVWSVSDPRPFLKESAGWLRTLHS